MESSEKDNKKMKKSGKNKVNKKIIYILLILFLLLTISVSALLVIFNAKDDKKDEFLFCSYSLYSNYLDIYNSAIIKYDEKNIINEITQVSNIEVFDEENVDINKLFNEQKAIDKEFSNVKGLTSKAIMPDENTLYFYQIRNLKKSSADFSTEEDICKKNNEYCTNEFNFSYGITVDEYIKLLKKYLTKTYELDSEDIVCK